MTDLIVLGLVLTTLGLALLVGAYEIMLHEDRIANIEEIELK
jgi:hypothetical protein